MLNNKLIDAKRVAIFTQPKNSLLILLSVVITETFSYSVRSLPGTVSLLDRNTEQLFCRL